MAEGVFSRPLTPPTGITPSSQVQGMGPSAHEEDTDEEQQPVLQSTSEDESDEDAEDEPDADDTVSFQVPIILSKKRDIDEESKQASEEESKDEESAVSSPPKKKQSKISDNHAIPLQIQVAGLICPIGQGVIINPVNFDGVTFEKEELEMYFACQVRDDKHRNGDIRHPTKNTWVPPVYYPDPHAKTIIEAAMSNPTVAAEHPDRYAEWMQKKREEPLKQLRYHRKYIQAAILGDPTSCGRLAIKFLLEVERTAHGAAPSFEQRKKYRILLQCAYRVAAAGAKLSDPMAMTVLARLCLGMPDWQPEDKEN